MSVSKRGAQLGGARARPASTLPSFDLRSVLHLFERRRWLFAVVCLSVAALAVAASLMITPRYTALATVKIDPTQRSAVDQGAMGAGQAPDSSVVDTEVSIIQSRQIAKAVVDRLHLVRDEEFGPKPPKLLARDTTPSPILAEQATIDKLLHRMGVTRQGATYLIDIGVTSENPEKAAAIANALVDEYLAFSQSSRSSAAQKQADVLNERLKSLGTQVESADSQLAQYQAATGIVSGGANFGTVNDQQISTIAGQLALAQSSAAGARSKANAARAQVDRGDTEAVVEVLSSPVIADLRRQRTEVVREQGQINARYGDRHPDAIRVRQQLQQLDQQIMSESRRIVSGLESDARAAEAQAGSLRSELSVLRGEQSAQARASVDGERLKRDAEGKRQIYDQLNAVAQKSAQEARLGQSSVQPVTAATPPLRPSFPNTLLFIALGFFLGAIAGASAVFAAEALDLTLHSAEDVETHLATPYLASLPMLSASQLSKAGRIKQPWDYVIARPMSSFAESLRAVRSALMLSKSDGRGEIITLTSAVPAEGKSVTAVSLGRIMAMSGDRVLMIDCDLRRNVVSDVLVERGQFGLVELLDGKASVEQVIKVDTASGLHVLPLSAATFSPRDLFKGEAFSALINSLRTGYDFVLIDAPPTLAVADARALSVASDRVLFLLRNGKTSHVTARTALDQLEGDGATVAGVVMTLVKSQSQVFGPEGQMAYYKGYRDYYQD